MDLKQAFKENLVGRFEIMALAEQMSLFNKQKKRVLSCKEIEFKDGKFIFHNPISASKKDIRLNLSILLTSLLELTDKKLTSIYMNHYLACLDDLQLYKYLPKSKRKPALLACGGLSGSGKSRVAREIAPLLNQPLGAVIIRDDIVRKQLAKVTFETQLDDSFYTPENEKRVYREMRRQIKNALLCGHTVVADALFYSPEERKKIEQLAKQLNVHFDGFWMTASLKTRLERVQTRKNNPSDVKTQQALQEQLSRNTGVIWWRVIDTEADREQTLLKVRKYLKKYL